ncbi:MAG TPA: ATP-grasp domain-containing protein [Elusimicrobiales bacterium]|nr:ATP-grasp domain-containing protein [Elusimicrobiales bacterium]
MNFVFISPHFPHNYYNFCVALRKYGVNVLGIGEDDFYALNPELQHALSWYYRVWDMHNLEDMRHACAFFSGKFGNIDGLDSLNEHWLENEAILRSEFGIPGVGSDTVALMRRKSEMKKVFAQAGVPYARGRVAYNAHEALEVAQETGFPIVLKPDGGVGAAHTHKFSEPHEIEAFYRQKPDMAFIAEEFVDGRMLTFDGLTDLAGDIAFCASLNYDRGVMEVVNEGTDLYYYTAREIAPDLEEMGRKIVKAYGLKGRFFHLEFFRKPDGTLVAVEANIRPPGGMTLDLYNFASDIDVYDMWARVIVGHEAASFEYEREYFCCYISRKSTKKYRYSHEQVLERYGEMVAFHGKLPELFRPVMGDYSYVIRAESERDVLEATTFIQRYI